MDAPCQKLAVLVQFFDEKQSKISPPLHIETDANGEAQFNISESPPENIDVRLALPSEHWHCACWVMADTETVLREGIVQIPPINVPNAPFAPASTEPGQIVFIARPFTFFEKLLYPLLKQQLDVAPPAFPASARNNDTRAGIESELVLHPLPLHRRCPDVEPISVRNKPDRDFVWFPGLTTVVSQPRSLFPGNAPQSVQYVGFHKPSLREPVLQPVLN
jgi:hypothetical protein